VKDALENLGYTALAVLAYLLLTLVVTLVLGRVDMAWALCKGFVVLWLIVAIEQTLQGTVQKVMRWSELEHLGVVIFNVLMVLGLCLAWAAFVALEVTRSVQGIGWLAVGLLYVLGLVGAWLGFGVVTGFFTGSLYRLAGLAVTVLGFVAFGLFPALAQGAFGWFFALGQ
jgi:hypothetical protein